VPRRRFRNSEAREFTLKAKRLRKTNGAYAPACLCKQHFVFDLGNEDDTKQEEIKTLLDNKELKWAMSIYYTLSNSF